MDNLKSYQFYFHPIKSTNVVNVKQCESCKNWTKFEESPMLRSFNKESHNVVNDQIWRITNTMFIQKCKIVNKIWRIANKPHQTSLILENIRSKLLKVKLFLELFDTKTHKQNQIHQNSPLSLPSTSPSCCNGRHLQEIPI